MAHEPLNNETLDFRATFNNTTLSPLIDGSTLYKYTPPLMLSICFVSIVINTRVLLAVKWIRRPLSPTLHISLSLAAADACTSFLIAFGLLVNSYLPNVHDIIIPCPAQMWLEMFRLSGVIVTVFHLLALSVNHWLGITKPLRYATLIVGTKMMHITAVLWLLPVMFFAAYFLICESGSGCSGVDDEAPTTTFFLDRFPFRLVFMSFFFVPFVLMIYFYAHILVTVRKQQRVWNEMSALGSKRSKGGKRKDDEACLSGQDNHQQSIKTLQSNIKAVYTTLLILGSYLIGWLPAVAIFIMICRDGCLYKQSDWSLLQLFAMGTVSNVLVILKTLINPIIYSARMAEIKDGMRRMELAVKQCFKGKDGLHGRRDNLSGNVSNDASSRDSRNRTSLKTSHWNRRSATNSSCLSANKGTVATAQL